MYKMLSETKWIHGVTVKVIGPEGIKHCLISDFESSIQIGWSWVYTEDQPIMIQVIQLSKVIRSWIQNQTCKVIDPEFTPDHDQPINMSESETDRNVNQFIHSSAFGRLHTTQ